MIKPYFGLVLGCAAMLLAGCGGGDAKPEAPPDMQEVWLQVDGMADRLKIV